MWRWKFC